MSHLNHRCFSLLLVGSRGHCLVVGARQLLQLDLKIFKVSRASNSWLTIVDAAPVQLLILLLNSFPSRSSSVFLATLLFVLDSANEDC